MTAREVRYPGARWRIAFGSYDGVQNFAVNQLQMMVQRLVPYLVEVIPAAAACPADDVHWMLAGTLAQNALILDLARRGAVCVPCAPQGYAVAVLESPWRQGRRVGVIAGADPAGVLHGTQDFNARVLASLPASSASASQAALESIPAFSASECPLVTTRGIWTWGYVIYDYRRFLDHMARLRMNSITVWNDCPPVNCPDFISYARSRGVGVILGFHWGWGTALDITKPDDRLAIAADVLAKYRQDYARLDIDAIYFQTLTEHSETRLRGRTTASWACQLVNEVSAPLFALNPGLRIHFGLHATSVLDNYADLAPLDPRVTIVWEDAGAIPFSYDPVIELPPAPAADAGPRTADQTLEYARRLASFRPAGAFGMVPKGWTSLDWKNEFEHHGPFVLGERSRDFTQTRLALRHKRWDCVNALWSANYPVAARFYREMLDAAGGGLAAWGLIEDGLLEEAIQFGAALFAETLWNPRRSDSDILARAMSPYYRMP